MLKCALTDIDNREKVHITFAAYYCLFQQDKIFNYNDLPEAIYLSKILLVYCHAAFPVIIGTIHNMYILAE